LRFVFSALRLQGHAVTVELPDRLLNVEESAAFLHCCQATVRREAIRGRLRGRKVGARWRFAPEDLHAYLARTGDDYAELIEEAVKVAPRLQPWQIQRLTALFDYRPTEAWHPRANQPVRD
jgi:excisionase family DNA binding protein